MVRENRVLIFMIGFICAWLLFSVFLKKADCQSSLPSNISFSGESNVIYLLDRDTSTIYRYDTQGRMTRRYVINELGKSLQLK
ncbi:MAG: hypothetical protein KKD90_01130 [Candidatus Omnitrophica bacterium]|nr:hypothetical protein [Candidatus Omnitrophota bacterium]MBU4149344.1 hypothetical protein [Candidatus Omnitrophota bacterium]